MQEVTMTHANTALSLPNNIQYLIQVFLAILFHYAKKKKKTIDFFFFANSLLI